MSDPEREPGLICFLLPLPEPAGFPHHNIYEFEENIDVPTPNPIPVFLTPGSPPIPARSSARVSTSLKIWQCKSSAVQLSAQIDAIKSVYGVITGSFPEPEAKPDIQTSITVIEAVTRLLQRTDEGVVAAFERFLSRVDSLIRAYGLATGHAVTQMTRQRMTDVVIYMIKDLTGNHWCDSSQLILGYNEVKKYAPPDLVVGTQNQMMQFLAQSPKIDPVLSYLELSAESRRAYNREGDLRTAIIYAETACEVLLDGVLQALLWEEGILAGEAAATFFANDWTLARRIKSNATYGSRLGGGHWKMTGDGPVARWYSDVAALRNRCAHAGYRPQSEEVDKADQSKKDLRDFVLDSLKRKCKSYPRTSSMFTNAAPRRPSLLEDKKQFSEWLEKFRAFGN